MKKEKIKKIVLFSALIGLFMTALLQSPVFSQENNPVPRLLTDPYLSFDAETEINAALNIKGPLNLVGPDDFKGEIGVAGLSGDRSYLLPDLSGEICLSAGNCLLSPQGDVDRLAKFTAQGLDSSSVQDLSQRLAVTIDEDGRVGIGIELPGHQLHVDGRIQANDDICTNLQGGRCLTDLERITSLFDTTIEGQGTPDRLPLWKENYQLGDSEIYQSGRNIGIGAAPAYKLDVAGTVRMLGFRLPVSPQTGYGLLSDDKGFGTWQPVLTPLAAGGDIAENFLIKPACIESKNCPEPGDLVSIAANSFIEKSSLPYDQKIIGLISTQPAMTLAGDLQTEASRPVALIGRVPLKVSLENGPVGIGDPLTSSSLAGIAKKAVQPGRAVGIALEPLTEQDFQNCDHEKIIDCQNKIGRIDILINLHNTF